MSTRVKSSMYIDNSKLWILWFIDMKIMSLRNGGDSVNKVSGGQKQAHCHAAIWVKTGVSDLKAGLSHMIVIICISMYYFVFFTIVGVVKKCEFFFFSSLKPSLEGI